MWCWHAGTAPREPSRGRGHRQQEAGTSLPPAGCPLSCKNLVPAAGTGCWGCPWGSSTRTFRSCACSGGLGGEKPVPSPDSVAHDPRRALRGRVGGPLPDRSWAKGAASHPEKAGAWPAGRAGGGDGCSLPRRGRHGGGPKTTRHPSPRRPQQMETDRDQAGETEAALP